MIRNTRFTLLLGWFAVVAVFGLPAAQANEHPEQRTVMLRVENMTCSMCTITVRMALENVPGVIKAEVTAEDDGIGLAKVIFAPMKSNVEALVRATTEAGYPSRLNTD